MDISADILFDFIRNAYRLLLHFMWPVSCPVCGRPAVEICGECLDKLLVPPLPRCLECGGLSPCMRHPDARAVRAAAGYGDDVKALILKLKYSGYRALGKILGEGAARCLRRPDADVLVPVPLHIGKKRGYNQSLEIAKGMGRVWGIEAVSFAQWGYDLPSQVGKDRDERMKLPEDVFDVSPEIAGLRVALVDDVYTSGTTMLRLASACRAAGADVVGGYVIASAQPHEHLE